MPVVGGNIRISTFFAIRMYICQMLYRRNFNIKDRRRKFRTLDVRLPLYVRIDQVLLLPTDYPVCTAAGCDRVSAEDE